MGWAKFDDKRHTSTKLAAAGLAANGLDANGITWCAAHETDGFVDEGALTFIAPGVSKKRATTIAAELVTVGRWTVDADKGGWWIHDYLKYNPSHVDLEAKREKERARKAAQGRNGSGQFQSGSDADSARNPHGSGAASAADTAVPDPTRPDPTRPDLHTYPPTTNSHRALPDGSGEGFTKREWALVDRLASGCKGRPDYVAPEAIRVVAHLARFVDWHIIDEAIGYSVANADTPPTLPRVIVGRVTSAASRHGITIPELASLKKRAS